MNNGPKVQIPVSNAFGQQSVKQIELDNNRPSIHRESLNRFSNMVALPSRGIYTDALLWVLSTAVLIRLLNSAVIVGLLPQAAAASIASLLISPVLLAMLQVVWELPPLRGACLYRGALMVLGIFVAIWGIGA
ncbi:hypothetical protein SPB21_02185 [Leptothoe sp. ISB3NOV94-8A]